MNECWDLQYFSSLKKFIPSLADNKQKRKMVNSVMRLYETHIQPLIPTMKRGVIHGDLHGRNIIIRRTADEKIEISGLIDFGDCVRSCYLFELAILASYGMMGKEEDPINLVVPLIQGYLAEFPLSEAELHCLYYAVLALLCTSAVKGEYNASLEPENMHIQQDISHAWSLLNRLLGASKREVDSTWNLF